MSKPSRLALLAAVQLELFSPKPAARAEADALTVGTRTVPLRFFHNRFARRYILRVQEDGSARVTIPRGGSRAEARNFAQRQTSWIEHQLANRLVQRLAPACWTAGTEILFRGVKTAISVQGNEVRVGDQIIPVSPSARDLRPDLERYFWRLAWEELGPRTLELAARLQLSVRRVSVRNQRTRWGSCSAKGVISLNWRLVQTPDWVRDYILVHELMHLREMNHSSRFWRGVEQACPQFSAAEAWLRQQGHLLRGGDSL